MGKPNTPGCNDGGGCCSTTCLVYADDFTRGDTSTIPNTTELVGNWANTSNALHPDHAASDQRLRFDSTGDGISSSPPGVQRITVRGQAGDRVGLAAILDADGNSFVESTIRFGTGTSGRLNMNRFTNGSLDWTWNEELECAANEYDIPVETPIAIELCHSYRGGLLLPNSLAWHFKVTIGETVHRLGYAEHQASPTPLSVVGGVVTGADAVTAYFDDYSYLLVNDYGDCDPSSTCEHCPHCELGIISASCDAEQIEGAWSTPSTGVVETEDANAILLWDDRLKWANDNMGVDIFLPGGIGGGPALPYKARIIFSWLDEDNYWYVEFHVYEGPIAAFPFAEWSIVHRSGGLETEMDSGETSAFAFSLGFRLMVWDCTIALWSGYPATVLQSCISDAALNNTGRWGLGTGDTVTELARFANPNFFCSTEFDCETIGDYEPPVDPPPDYPPPGDPFDSCCPDFAGVGLGDPYLVQLLALDVDTGPGCPDTEICNDTEIAVFLAMSDFHTVNVVYYNATTLILYGDTGVVVPCSGSEETVKIWIEIVRTGENECTIRGIVFIATCHIYYQTTITEDTDCVGTEIDYAGRPGDATCCLYAAGPMVLSLP